MYSFVRRYDRTYDTVLLSSERADAAKMRVVSG